MNILARSSIFLVPTIGLLNCAFNEHACSFLIKKSCSVFFGFQLIASFEIAQSNLSLYFDF
jgi:hypothetical protein